MTSLILSRRDVEFLMYEWLDVTGLCRRERYAEHSRETFDAALDTSEAIATEHFYPINPLLDRDEPQFDGERVSTPAGLKSALRAFSDAGLMAAGQDFLVGGMQLPCVVEKACFAYFNGASVAAAGYALLTIGNSNLLAKFASPELVERYLAPMLEGRFFGTMCLSEPQAGSSLSDIRTRAQPQADGTYRLRGNKMWISGGEQDLTENIVHLVLAKIPGPDGQLVPGVKGISLFVVPKVLPDGQRNDVVLAGLNHKMGNRGTTNCLLNFGEGRFTPHGEAGALGWLVGEPGQGLSYMFHMMNEARIGVGLGAVMLGYTGYLHSLDYARNRPQGRMAQAKNPAAPQVPIIRHADIRRMLLAQKSYVEGGLALTLYCARLVDDERTDPDAGGRQRANQLLELLTPVAKSWPSQWCQEANSHAIQIHGGYGYTRDYRVEQFYRDQRLNPIHEGTHGIQGLDLLGRKVRLGGGQALAVLGDEVARSAVRARALGGEWALAADQVESAGNRLRDLVTTLYAADNLDVTLANASVFLEAFGHFVLAWIWLEQAVVAVTANGRLAAGEGTAAERAFYAGKLQAARYFLRWELPRIEPMIALLASLDTTTLDMGEDWF